MIVIARAATEMVRGTIEFSDIANRQICLPMSALPGEIVRMPANIPHAVDAPERAKMLLIMLREPNGK